VNPSRTWAGAASPATGGHPLADWRMAQAERLERAPLVQRERSEPGSRRAPDAAGEALPGTDRGVPAAGSGRERGRRWGHGTTGAAPMGAERRALTPDSG
jgi:hypothetical protein